MNSLNIEQMLKYDIRPFCHGTPPYAKFRLVEIIIHMNNHDSTKIEQS